MTTTLLLVLLVLVVENTGQEVAGDLEVDIGRKTDLDPGRLLLHVRRDEICKVEVNSYDHMSLRVGHVEPKTFDCRFKAGQVQYIHSGSPLLHEDKISLKVYRFMRTESSVEDVHLTIKIKQEPYDLIHTMRPVKVKRFNGHSNPIDDSVIRFRYEQDSNATCMVGFSRYSTPWPAAGQMVVGSKGAPVDSLWRNCHEFLQYGLRYQHLVPPTPDVDYLPLKVQIHHPFSGIKVERMYLPIHIDTAFANIPPKTSFMKSFVMEVDQFTMTVLPPTVMSAQDNETPQGSLVYNVTKILGRGQGHLIHLADRTQSITSFLQSDLTNQNIAYQPPMIPYPDQTDFQMELTVFDASFQSSLPSKFHISVRPTHTDAPRIALNTGLIVLEGAAQPILSSNLLIVDNDLSNVHIYIKGGLQHGSLTINDRPVMSFTPRDLELGQVIYKHDGSDTTSDSLLLRITDGINTVQTRLHIHIVADDDTPPVLVNKFDLDIQEGDVVQISESMLYARDEDSSRDDIVYRITRIPKYGQLIFKTSARANGVVVTHFTQADITKGYIHYHQTVPDSLLDSVSFVIEDLQIPPNVSPEFLIMIRIRPPYNAPPRRVPGTDNSITTKETDVVYIDKYRLAFEDPDTDSDHILYTVTAQPFFISSQETVDAGRLINIHNLSVVVKDDSMPALLTFTQAEIDHMKIAYMPPIKDIGPHEKRVKFYYTVSDDTGNIRNGLSFQINITPVNNQPPEFLTNPLSVHEGGHTGVTVRQISVIDSDTLQEDITLSLDVRPSRGILKFDGVAMDIGDKFTLEDIGKSRLSYWHDGSDDQATDSFGISASDGEHRLTKAIPVNVILIDDQPPKLETKASRKFDVEEGGVFKLTPDVLSAMDGDTPPDNIRFTIIKTPSKGSIMDGDTLVSRFTQNDIEKGRIRYVHNGKEIGSDTQDDSFQFILSDIPLESVDDHEIDYVNITITPVNNHAPSIVLGNPVIVLEGGKTKIGEDLIAARDADSPADELRFIILKYPDWGFIERSRSKMLSESVKPERVNEFWWTDIQEGLMTYVQGRHQGVEPVSDTMTLKVTDGKFYSPETLVVITVIPQNDEMPEILLESLNVTQGYDTMIGAELLMVTDLDVPHDVCIISVPIMPAHGHLTMLVPVSGRDGMVQVPVHEFSMNDVKKGVRLLYKHYGGDESMDSMMIKVNDGKHITEREVRIDIIQIVDERPEVIKNAGLKVRYGDKVSTITGTLLQAMDRDTDEDHIMYVIVNKPSHGKLQKLKQKLVQENSVADKYSQSDQATLQRIPEWEEVSEGMNFTQKDLNQNLVRYIHSGQLRESETDKFRFRVTDGVSTSPKETFEILIEKTKISDIKLAVKNIKVKERRSVTISAKELSATDGTDMLNRITFIITQQPRYGHIELNDDKGTPVRNFTQSDLVSLRVRYVHTSWSEAVEDRFQFIVSNGHFIQNGTMYILIVPSDRITPTLEKNEKVFVALNKEVQISSEFLNALDPDTPKENLTYMIMKLPDYGELLVGDSRLGQEFYQSDIDDGRLRYRSFGQKAGVDEFWFAVTDRKHIGFIVNGTLKLSPVPFKIEITATEYTPPRLLYNRPPNILDTFSLGRVGYLITNKLLKVISTSDEPAYLRYLLIEQPRNGHLENLVTGQKLGYSFTQADVDADSIVYVVDESRGMNNDSFIFTVEDSRGNVMDPATYTLSWSVVQFRQAHYVVCEDVGRLSIPIARHGNIDQPAYINIRVREMSAKNGHDFDIPSLAQIQFDAGVSAVTWNVDIREDEVLEKHEKVKLILKSPINSVLGRLNKTTITIVNKNTDSGACARVRGILLGPESSEDAGTDTVESDEPDDEDEGNQAEEATAMVPQSDAAAQSSEVAQANSLLVDLASRIPLIKPQSGNAESSTSDAEGVRTSPTILSIDRVSMRKAFNRLEEDTSGRIPGKVRRRKGRRKKDGNVEGKKGGRRGGRRRKDREQRRRERQEKRRRNRKRKKNRDKSDDPDSDPSRKSRRRKERRNRRREETATAVTEKPAVVEPKGGTAVLVGIPTQATVEEKRDPSLLSDSDKKGPVISEDMRSQLIQQWSSLEPSSNNDTKQNTGGCNPTTKGFYHKDPATNKVYRCDGYGWVTVTNIRIPSPERQHNRRRSQEPIITGENIEATSSQCPEDWVMFSGRCYLPFEEKETWDDAESKCTRIGGHLPSMWARKQSMWMISMVGRKRMWIGLNDKAAHLQWTYTNNDPVTYTNWRQGYPDGRKAGNKNCVMISRDLTWSNRPCSHRKARFVCSKLPSSISRRFDLK